MCDSSVFGGLVTFLALVLLPIGCGGLDSGDDTVAGLLVPAAETEPLTLTGQVLDPYGRPLWNIGVWLATPGTSDDEPAASAFTWPDGHYDLEAPAAGVYELRFVRDRFEGAETLAVVDVDTEHARPVDLTIDDPGSVSCRLLTPDGDPRPITSYAMWADGPSMSVGTGGSCGSTDGGDDCGPTALTFIWPRGYERVELSFGRGRGIALTSPADTCDVREGER